MTIMGKLVIYRLFKWEEIIQTVTVITFIFGQVLSFMGNPDNE